MRVRVQMRLILRVSALATKKTEAQRERWNRAVVAVLAATRRDKDVSQDALAEKLGVSRDVVATSKLAAAELR